MPISINFSQGDHTNLAIGLNQTTRANFLVALKSNMLNLVVGEIPGGDVNGINKDFTTLVNFALLWVWKNGVRQYPTESFVTTGSNSFQFVDAPETGNELLVDYTT